ncbi:MAG: hypothetical protein JWN56_2451 [Sphingobacteriales bacterium]|nr:hypothetical protein [Sphingobacteriales bacterium]
MRTILFIIFISVVISCKKTEIPKNEPITQQEMHKGYKDLFIGSFRCGVFIPPSYDPTKKYPLVVYLHGYSDTTTWNLGWYQEPIVSSDPCIVITPKCPTTELAGWGHSYSTVTTPMMAKTFEMIELLKKQYNLDPDRFYIHGTSLGAIGTYGVIRKNPDMFAAAYALCGNGNPQMAATLSTIPFWSFHGDADDVVPVAGSRDIYNEVVRIGGKQIRYTEYKGVGHDVWNYTPPEIKIDKWLLAQRKGVIFSFLPDKVNGFKGNLNNDNKVFLEWDKPASEIIKNNKLWYYKVFRNDLLIAEVDTDYSTFTDSLANNNSTYNYKISAVNYHFKESNTSLVEITTK